MGVAVKERWLVDVLRDALQGVRLPKGVIVDCGAGIGQYSEIFRTLGNRRVTFFESHDGYYDELRANIRRFGLNGANVVENMMQDVTLPSGIALATIGFLTFQPKTHVYDWILNELWPNLKKGGVAHFEFMAMDDSQFESAEWSLMSEDGYTGSFIHMSSFQCQMNGCGWCEYGYSGGSFMAAGEFVAQLRALGLKIEVLADEVLTKVHPNGETRVFNYIAIKKK